jgi:hypothetical protein
MFSTSLQFPKTDSPEDNIARNGAVDVTFRDFGGSNRLSSFTVPNRSNGTRSVDDTAYFAR